MRYTGERFIPTDEPWTRRLAVEHLHRYYMTAPYLKDKTVLDAACGSGYGSELLSVHAHKVVGVDISREAIEYAAENFKAPNIEFVAASVDKLPFEPHSFDAVVSFETIEHISEAVQRAFLNEIKRILKPGGVLIISTPNKTAISDKGGTNIYHIRELYTDEFTTLLSGFFNSVQLHVQEIASASLITGNAEDGFNILDPDSLLGSSPLYNIAICADDDSFHLPPSFMPYASFDAAHKRFCFDALNDNRLLCDVFTDINAGVVYFSDGGAFSEERKLHLSTCYSPDSGNFSVEFHVLAGTAKIQYNPCDSFLCMCRIESISDGLSIEPVNMEKLDGYDIALSPYPHYYITGDFSKIVDIRITGIIKILTPREFLTLLRDYMDVKFKKDYAAPREYNEAVDALLEEKDARLLVAEKELDASRVRELGLNRMLLRMNKRTDLLLKKLDDRDNAIAMKESEINALTAARDELTLELAGLRNELDATLEALTEKSAQYASILDQLDDAVRKNAALESELLLCGDSLSFYRETALPDLRRHAASLEEHILNLQYDISQKDHIISEIHTSNAWALVRKYYGLKDFYKNIVKPEPKRDIISVVIPTKNAGDNFSLLLSCLNAQNGIQPDIIVVDSGSDDATCDIAAEHGAHVITMPPESFSHSYARNLGISKARGAYTLLLTQDALPNSENFMLDMLCFIKKEGLAAASCLEFPRPGCDMIHSFSSWNHIRTLGYGSGDYISSIGSGDDASDMTLLRRNTNLNNVCCMIKTELAKKYKYRGDYAEDLEMGLRLYKSGHRLGFMQSCRILHSHRRLPLYHLKRTFADTLALSKLLPVPRHQKYTLQDFSGNVLRCLSALSHIIPAISVDKSEIFTVAEYCHRIDSAFMRARETPCERGDFALNDEALSEITGQILQYDNGCRPDALLISLQGTMERVFEYLSGIHDLIDHSISTQLDSLLLCLFASKTGEFCAYYSMDYPEEYAETLAKIISASEI